MNNDHNWPQTYRCRKANTISGLSCKCTGEKELHSSLPFLFGFLFPFGLTKALKSNSQPSDLSGSVSFLFSPGRHEWEEINLLISSAELIIVRADLQKCIGMSWMGDTGNEPWLNEVGCRSPSCGLLRDNRTGTIIQWANHVARSGKGPHRVNLSQWISVHISIYHRQ